MPDHLRPVFPPESPNVSKESIEAASELLDDQTRDTLNIDRARLTQATASVAIALTDALGLSPDTAEEVQRALISRLPELSHPYHSYTNQLLGNSAMALTGQEGHTTHIETLAVVDASPPADLEDIDEPIPTDPGHVPDPKPETDTPEFDEADLLVFETETKFAQHSKQNNGIKEFVKKLFDEKGLLDGLSPQEVSLVGYQLLNVYLVNKIPNSSDSRKAAQKECIELYFALYGTRLSSEDICKKLNISGPSFNSGIRRVIESLKGLVTKEDFAGILQKAKVTSEFGPKGLFVDPEELDVEDSEAEEQDEEEIIFKEYPRTPANMSNFLAGIYPPNYFDRLQYLDPWQASYLTFKLIKFWEVELAKGTTPEESQATRITYLTRWTGLNEEAQDYDVIARARAVISNSVYSSITASMGQIAKKLGLDGLEKLYEEAMNYAKPIPSS